ncbi:hypothetical protein D3C87_1056230 [compost metagenome]
MAPSLTTATSPPCVLDRMPKPFSPSVVMAPPLRMRVVPVPASVMMPNALVAVARTVALLSMVMAPLPGL